MASPFDQARYQVRLEWGVAGLDRLAASDVVVVVDVLSFSTRLADRVAAGESVALADIVAAPRGTPDASVNGAAVAQRAHEKGAVVVAGCLRNAHAVADAVLAEQVRRGARTSVAVIAAGELPPASADGSRDSAVRVAVEDLLGAGAVVDALARLGLDHSSPEAAAACESFRGLAGAVRHLLTASGSGQELAEAGRRDDVLHAAEANAVASVPVLRDGVFVAA